ncbi:MAG: peptidoglycan bridge formation glycyltransferase FemA/FemB family protein [Verrucomicrobia bacterium]|nr:peptidoglycan bridge formation glycyltransferase FemA/FemB family protein [Verrucomicrobiota bacterium]
MLVYPQKGGFLKADAILVWWPRSVQDIRPFLDQAAIVILWQCPAAMMPELRPWIFRCRPFQTPLIDLALTEEALWQGLEAKSCRYEVRKAQKMEFVVSRNEETEAARKLINDSIRRLRYRAEVGEEEWEATLPSHDIFLCRWQGIPLAAHTILRDHPGRARLLLSGGVDRSDERFRSAVGPANRLLHWHEMLYYKAEGFRFYDFGGCDPNPESSHYSITQFKLSFGGETVEEPIVYLAKNPARRGFFQGIGVVRGALRRIPWPETWLQAIRSRPRLLSWLR